MPEAADIMSGLVQAAKLVAYFVFFTPWFLATMVSLVVLCYLPILFAFLDRDKNPWGAPWREIRGLTVMFWTHRGFRAGETAEPTSP